MVTPVKEESAKGWAAEGENEGYTGAIHGSKTTAKSTPVVDKAEESDESMIESCSSESDSEEDSKVKDFNTNNLVSNSEPGQLSETNLRLFAR